MGFEFWAFIEFSFCFCFFSCCLFFYLPDALEDADRVVAGAGEGDEGAGGHLADFQHRRGAAGADQRHQLLQVGRKRFRRRSTGKAVGWRVRTRRVDAEATEQQQDGKQRRIRPESTRFRSVFDAPTQLFFFFQNKKEPPCRGRGRGSPEGGGAVARRRRSARKAARSGSERKKTAAVAALRCSTPVLVRATPNRRVISAANSSVDELRSCEWKRITWKWKCITWKWKRRTWKWKRIKWKWKTSRVQVEMVCVEVETRSTKW